MVTHESVNDYKAVIVPVKFDFLKGKSIPSYDLQINLKPV
jgi:hypothetical protein